MHSAPGLPQAPLVLVEPLRASDIAETAQLLADAFADNPTYAFMHPRASSRSADMVAFFTRNLSWHAPLGLTWIARASSGAVVGTATLEPPGGVVRPITDTIRHWVWPTLRDQGFHTVARIVEAQREFAAHNTRTAGSGSYWHVHAVAVSPKVQGQGVGSSVLRTLMGELASRNAVCPAAVVLSTQREVNLPFYARFGFRVTGRVTMGKTRATPGFVSWLLRYAP